MERALRPPYFSCSFDRTLQIRAIAKWKLTISIRYGISISIMLWNHLTLATINIFNFQLECDFPTLYYIASNAHHISFGLFYSLFIAFGLSYWEIFVIIFVVVVIAFNSNIQSHFNKVFVKVSIKRLTFITDSDLCTIFLLKNSTFYHKFIEKKIPYWIEFHWNFCGTVWLSIIIIKNLLVFFVAVFGLKYFCVCVPIP